MAPRCAAQRFTWVPKAAGPHVPAARTKGIPSAGRSGAALGAWAYGGCGRGCRGSRGCSPCPDVRRSASRCATARPDACPRSIQMCTKARGPTPPRCVCAACRPAPTRVPTAARCAATRVQQLRPGAQQCTALLHPAVHQQMFLLHPDVHQHVFSHPVRLRAPHPSQLCRRPPELSNPSTASTSPIPSGPDPWAAPLRAALSCYSWLCRGLLGSGRAPPCSPTCSHCGFCSPQTQRVPVRPGDGRVKG